MRAPMRLTLVWGAILILNCLRRLAELRRLSRLSNSRVKRRRQCP